MANKAPAFQLYADKALAGTDHLPPVAFKAYWRMVFWMWLHSDDQCSIMNELNAILGSSRLTKRQYKRVWETEIMPAYHPMFKVIGNRLVCSGLRKEVEKQQARRDKAKASANARWNSCERNANASPEQCSLTPTPTTSLKKEGNTPPGSGHEMGLRMVVDAFCSKTRWAGNRERVYDEFRMLQKDFSESVLSEKVAKIAVPGMKPWVFADSIREKAGPQSEFTEAQRSEFKALQFDVRSRRVKQLRSQSGKVVDVCLYDERGEYIAITQNGEKLVLDLRAFVAAGYTPYQGRKPERKQPKEDAIAASERRKVIQAQKIALHKAGVL